MPEVGNLDDGQLAPPPSLFKMTNCPCKQDNNHMVNSNWDYLFLNKKSNEQVCKLPPPPSKIKVEFFN